MDTDGSIPFSTRAARLVRHVIMNAPIVSVIDVHSFGADLSAVTKQGPQDDENGIVGAGGLDGDNLADIENEAIDVFNDAAEDAWQTSTQRVTDALPSILTVQGAGRGDGYGQMPSWAARQPTANNKVEFAMNFDFDSYLFEFPIMTV